MPKKDKALKGLGAKYGVTLRRKYTAAYRLLKMRRICPSCGSARFKRLAIGIWACRKCGLKVAGEAYDVKI